MRKPPHRWGGTALGFYPALLGILMAVWMLCFFGDAWIWVTSGPGTWILANLYANLVMLGVLVVAYVVWILAVARAWVTEATGGGLTIAAYALTMRIIVEFPQSAARTPLSEIRPPDPYGTVLVLARTLGLAAYVTGLAFVVAAVASERHLRRKAPNWAITP